MFAQKTLLDQTTVRLLKFAKTKQTTPITWRLVRSHLSPLYHPDLRLPEVFEIVLRVYLHALDEPRFKLPSLDAQLQKLFFSPVQGPFALYSPITLLDDTCTLEQFYDALIREMLATLNTADTDWCHTLLYPDA